MTKASDNYALLVQILRSVAAVNDSIAHAASQAMTNRPQEMEKLRAALRVGKGELEAMELKLKDGWRR